MTNREYMAAVLCGLNVGEAELGVMMLRGGINPEAECADAACARACDVAIYDGMSTVFKGMAQNVSEGGYSVSWNVEAARCYYRMLCAELGRENVLEKSPKVRSRALW